MWKEIICIALAVFTISADELIEDDRTSSFSEGGETSSREAGDSGADGERSSSNADELNTRFLGIGDAIRRVNGAITGAVKGAVMGAVTGHMQARRPPPTTTNDDDDDDDID